MKRSLYVQKALACLLVGWSMVGEASAEVILQYFTTEWEEMYRRMPEIGEIGYDGMWIPSPCKSPVAGAQKFSNVGYSLYDRFDLGDIPQRGTRETRYGDRGDLRQMVDNAHQHDVKIYPDVVFNHNGNGPDFRTYPGMRPNDFHGWWNGSEPGGFRRAARMTSYDDVSNGFGGTFKEELVSLIDVVTERDQRFNNNPFTATPDSFVRHPGQYDKYPFNAPGSVLPSEYPWEMLDRWAHWLGDAMDYDGFRLDAAKHVVHEFYGPRGSGFLHEAQWNFDQRNGNTYDAAVPTMYQNDVVRDDMLMFAEIFTGSSATFDYWRNGDVRMRYLDFPLKQSVVGSAFSGGNLASLGSLGAGLDPTEGVMFVQSHDQSGPSKLTLGYAYLLTHVGLPIVYTTGNNIDSADNNTRTWVLPGYDAALGDWHNKIPNLVYIHNQFARGREYGRKTDDNDLWIHERYDDTNTNQNPDSGEGLLLVGLNDSGLTRSATVSCSFADGTLLHDYTGNNGNDVTVSGGTAFIEVPPGPNNEGYVCYAPYNASADGVPIRFDNGTAPTMVWDVPGGIHATNKLRNITRLTGNSVDIDVHFFNPIGGTVDNVIVKWGRGRDLNAGATDLGGNDPVTAGYEQATQVSPGHWRLTADLANVPDGLHLVKARCFNAGTPVAVYQTFSTSVYVDRVGPDVIVTTPTEAATIPGACTAIIENPDFLAYGMTVSTDGGPAVSADEIMKGKWVYSLSGLSSGTHTMTVTTTEADWGTTRSVINTSVDTRTFTVAPAANIGIEHNEGDVIELPFFTTAITNVPGGATSVRLFWDGYEQVGLTDLGGGRWEHTFDGRYTSGGVEDRLWGAFVNGPHWFEAEIIDGGVTSKSSRRVYFNLYGMNLVDSDGDGLPDDVERPGFIAVDGSLDGVGPNAAWPGDNNQDMIPNDGETWTRLNPLNHDTDYAGNWDSDEDWDGDGIPNLCEVWKGYYAPNSNPFLYDIYNSSSKPADCTFPSGGGPVNPVISVSPANPQACPGAMLTFEYSPNEGPLTGIDPIHLAIDGVGVFPMNDIGGGDWQYVYDIPTTATAVVYWFQDGAGSAFDNNSGANYSKAIGACIPQMDFFTMDGSQDGNDYLISDVGMKIAAAVKGTHLYVATWSANGGGNDHFILVTDEFGESEPAPWAKAGEVFFSKAAKPWVAGESEASAGFNTINNGGNNGRTAMGSGGQVLEAEFDLVEVFGAMPETVYIAAMAYGDNDSDALGSQGPAGWSGLNGDIETYEFLPVPVASIADEDLDGYFDVGKPQMWTVVNGNTNSANYQLRRFFLDETVGETGEIRVILDPGTDPGDTVSDVELFSNLNRRDFAVLEEDRSTVSTTSGTTYYRAYAMAAQGNGTYAITLPVTHCGAYRLDARFRINGGDYVYVTDSGLRRDTAVVVSPRKALELTMYELNPMIAEAQDSTFFGRSTFKDMYLANTNKSDYINTQHFVNLGTKMLWLQPIHPIGGDGRQYDPETGAPYDPGSPYAVQNYWQVSAVLGDPSSEAQAMQEFQDFAAEMDANGVGIMMDGTFNHSAWDCQIGQVGVDMFAWATDPDALIRDIRPEWYSNKNDYRQRASYYNGTLDNDIGTAPDRTDFGKWSDAADFNFGSYDTLVGGQGEADRSNFLFEQDRFDGHDSFSREIWEYFAAYPIYWLEKTGHPAGTPKTESHRGIDGLRCDFAQGLPSQFWEYCINKTRSVKWDFIFMAESLDGFREVNGSKRHGIGYRSARHFDVLNENLVFTWRDQFFDYFNPFASNRDTGLIFNSLAERREAFALCPILLNLTSHDEIFPSDDPFSLFYAYTMLATIDGVPMLMYGQEAGAQNDINTYGMDHPDIQAIYNFDKYELNFGKAIPNFKRYNNLKSVWDNRGSNGNKGWKVQAAYGRANQARCDSPALQSQDNYFLNVVGGGFHGDIFAVAKFEEPGVSAAEQDVVLCFVNNNIEASTNREATFDVSATVPGGANWFGIDPAHMYNAVDLLSTNPAAEVLEGGTQLGSTLISSGVTVKLIGDATQGEQAKYLRLIDKTESFADADGDGIGDFGDPDDDNDRLPDDFENANNLDPLNPNGINGADGDKDGDGATNYEEFLAGTNADDITDVLAVADLRMDGPNTEVDWDAVPGKNYQVQSTSDLGTGTWQSVHFTTALSSVETVIQATDTNVTQRHYRAVVKP